MIGCNIIVGSSENFQMSPSVCFSNLILAKLVVVKKLAFTTWHKNRPVLCIRDFFALPYLRHHHYEYVRSELCKHSKKMLDQLQGRCDI